MLFENLLNSELGDVKTFIESNINGLKDVNDIINNDTLKNSSKIFPLKNDEINQMINNWQIISQSTLNLFNEPEPKKIFGIGDSSAIRRPTERNVVEILYQYVLWHSVGKYISSVRDFQIDFACKLGITSFKCEKCATENQIDELECSMCGESVMSYLKANIRALGELKEKINKNENNEQMNNISMKNKNDENSSQWKCEYCGNANEFLSNRCAGCPNLRRESNDRSDNPAGDGFIENWDCWWRGCIKKNYGNHQYCSHCGVDRAANQNRGEIINAFKDGKEEKIWICTKCGLFNGYLDSDKCEICECSRKEEKENKYEQNRGRLGNPAGGEIDENWDCWSRSCRKRNYGNHQYCSHCGVDKAANQNRGEIINVLKDGRKEEMWICNGCNHFNWDINAKICRNCYESRYEIECAINKANENWKCQQSICGKANVGSDKYCSHCGVDRAANQNRGEIINAFKDGKEEKMWICTKCGFHNGDLDSDKCEICEEMRYEKDAYEIITDVEMKRAAGELDDWKCGKCECVNNYHLVSCKACGEIKEKLCNICSERFQAAGEICPGCNARWKCWYNLCGEMNNRNVDYCKYCGLGKGDAGKYGILIARWLSGECDEIWICRSCWLVNKGCSDCCKASRYCSGKRDRLCYYCKCWVEYSQYKCPNCDRYCP